MILNTHRLLFCLMWLGMLASAPARAEDYPSRPITIVVSLAADSGMDAIARLYAERLSQAFGKPVIVENKPGAATTLAANQAAGAGGFLGAAIAAAAGCAAVRRGIGRRRL